MAAPCNGAVCPQSPRVPCAQANVVASILSGNILPGYGRKLAEGEAPKVCC